MMTLIYVDMLRLPIIRKLLVGTSLLCLYFYPLCYAAVLLKFTYYTQYYAQEQELVLLSDYYAFYMQFCMRNLLHVADNFYKI